MPETSVSSPTKTVTIGPDHPFVIIGERINPTGRRLLAAQMGAMDFSRVQQDAVAQVAAGAQMLDVNAGVPGADEPAILAAAIRAVQEVVDVPLSLDSSVIEALEAGLQVYQGKPLINSVTGEDASLERVLPLAKKHGAAVVGIANDERGIPATPEGRLEIARKIVERAQDYGISPNDVVVDPLAMTVGADHRAATVTLETVRLIRQELGVNTVCGASNISFGLPDRLLLNVAFLAMAIGAGLTAAITNPLEETLRKTVSAADVMMGHDEYCQRWIASVRGAAGRDRPSRRRRRRASTGER
ncbi:MAG: dihydropteroate synthase [Chloroflexi bacterium]|nr:dihydropteroate synthase [Chloroflexota bacterium]